MAIPLYGGIGALFNVLGKCGLLIKQLATYQTSQRVNLIDTTNGLVAQLNNNSDIQALVGDSYIGILSGSGCGAVGSLAQQVAVAEVNRLVFNDNPRINQTLQTANTLASLQEVIRQMKQAGATVLAATITAIPTQFTSNLISTNIGNGVLNYSVNRPVDGKVLENIYTEMLQLLCTNDSYNGGATAGNEAFQITGSGAQSDLFAFNWPLGSNAQSSLNAIDGNANVASGNLLTNSGFASFTNNIPNNFMLVTGVTGTNVAQETVLTYGGGSALKISGDANSTLTTLTQQFNSSSGSNGTLFPLSQYSINLWMRRDGTAANRGQWTIDLVDQNNTIVVDANGVANSFTIDLTTLTTIYQPFSGVFRTPKIMPSQLSIRMRHPIGNSLQNGRSVYADKLSLGSMSQMYTQGPFLAIHSGSIPFSIGDYAYCAFSNSRGSANTLNTFQTLWFRLFNTTAGSNELLLPSSATPNIADALIG